MTPSLSSQHGIGQRRAMDVSSIRSTNWSGSVPIVLSLAPTSLSSPSMPASIHVLVPRNTFLHVGLQNAVMHLHKFAPVSFPNIIRSEPDPGASEEGKQRSSSTTTSSKDTVYPVCWFQDEDTQFALRWHLFVGVLWDMKATKSIPWKIRLHFTQYPSSQILPLENCVLTTIEHNFMNSLKQALFLQYGSSKVAMSMTKQTHERVWDSIVTSNYQLYQQVNDDLQQTNESSMNILPVRLMVDSKPPIQRPCRFSKGELIRLFCVLLILSCACFFC